MSPALAGDSLPLHLLGSPWDTLKGCDIASQSVQLLSHVQLFATPWTAARQASLSITNSQSLLKRMSIKSVLPSSHLILCPPLLLLPSIFPSDIAKARKQCVKLWDSFSLHACVLSHFSRVWLFETLWTVAYWAPLSMGFSRQEYWSGLLCPPPGGGYSQLRDHTPVFCIAGRFFTTWVTWETPVSL